MKYLKSWKDAYILASTKVWIIIVLLIICSCHTKEQRFELLPSSKTGITFTNAIATNDTLNALNFDYIYNGGGVAVGDINNDGLPDLFFSGNMVPSKLYLNKGNLEFEDISHKLGIGENRWATGASFVDINGNGHVDLYVCVASKDPDKSKNMLFINDGSMSFSEEAESYGLDDNGYSTHAAFFDYDGDGDLDLYLLTNAYETSNRNFVREKKVEGESKSTDRLYRNNGDGTFSNVSKEAGILIEGYGLGVAIADINRDGLPDVYVANDFITNDLLWINQGDGTFSNEISDYLKHQSFNGMGVDIADFNNDGWVDIAVMDMLPPDNLRQKTMFPDINYNQFQMILSLGYEPQYVRNTLQLNNGNHTFSEIAYLAGVHETDWSWAPLFADFDNSGHKDLFITNGYRKDVTNLDFIVYNREREMFGTEKANREEAMKRLEELEGAHIHNYMFKNKGTLVFEDVSEEWGFQMPTYSNGAAFVDLDNDGDLDLVINNIDSETSIYQNHSSSAENANYLQIKLVGNTPNIQGIGAKITIYTTEGIQYQENSPYRGYKSTVDPVLHFGLGSIKEVEKLEVVWPDGKSQKLENITSNQRLELYQNQAKESAGEPPLPLSQSTVFTQNTEHLGIEHSHFQTDYVDFKDQFLLPHKLSQSGPGIAVGDIDGDGKEDFFVGGGAGYPGALFLQKEEGFEKRDFLFHQEANDMGALFFDANGNGHQDLYVVSGGNANSSGKGMFQDRLYLNDGKGQFTHAENALPELFASGSTVIAADFDADGDLDLFIGGRVTPGSYPYPAQSYLLENRDGEFVDVSAEYLPNEGKIGMVSDAVWLDFDGDGMLDLVLVGEWMPITLLKGEEGAFIDKTADFGLSSTKGWWNSISVADLTGNGRMDFVLGNQGLNSRFKASKKEPIRIYADDFDHNQSVDPIITRYIQGKEYAVHPRDNLISQIPSMKRRFPRYKQYGEATIDKVLGRNERQDALKFSANYLESAILLDLGEGNFELRPLPIEAQISPTYGTLIGDFNEDGNLDLLLVGNNYATEIHSGWHDAGIGLYLTGDGKGNFTPLNQHHSGFFVDTDAKGMASIWGPGDTLMVLVASNQDKLYSFSSSIHAKDQLLKPKRNAFQAVLYDQNGHSETIPLLYGNTYLSQSSSLIKLKDSIKKIEWHFPGGKVEEQQVSMLTPKLSATLE
ncbi:VCBS repeat-containing protein [Pleomorphovibrio marinus]|uniref:VCBS repeat-containing protein n=1 Tax=Pleomorphovibrio marinus TaxID=2164132 RepID=UPI000E0B7372|nr:VCBS repeat-containing protein [Pleomorphovibrio marinus]